MRCRFYTLRRRNGKTAAEEVTGYTDGYYRYYKNGSQWCSVHPVYGLAIYFADTRKAAQDKTLANLDAIARIDARHDTDTKLQEFAALIRAAQTGNNVSFF